MSKLEKVFDSAKSENLSEAQELEALVASTTDDEAAKGGEQSTADEQTTADEQESEVETAREPPEEEVIRCVCNILREYGEMWQCEKCKVRPSLHLLRNFPENCFKLFSFCFQTWQHTICIGNISLQNYQCELCRPRSLSKV